MDTTPTPAPSTACSPGSYRPNITSLRLRFTAEIEEADRLLRGFLATVAAEDLAVHNAGWGRSKDLFDYFVATEKNRFLVAADLITASTSAGSVVDMGCHIPYLPVLLKLLGFRVKIVDRYNLYGAGFKHAIELFAQQTGLELFDLDMLVDDYAPLGTNDVVLLMAVVEHLSGSPRELMRRIQSLVSNTGFLVFEVPNIAEFTKRLRALAGRSPLPDYPSYFASSYPFVGHNREMTQAEVAYLLENTGYSIEQLFCYDYANAEPRTLAGRLALVLKRMCWLLSPRAAYGQLLTARARRRPA